MSMPLCRAFTPLALEMMIGRLPVAAGSATPSDAGSAPKSFGVPATAVAGRGGGGKFRGDRKLVGGPLEWGGGKKRGGGEGHKEGGVPRPFCEKEREKDER